MARTSEYEVVYADGRERRKLLTDEDAEQYREQKGIKSVTRAQANKQRQPASNKAA